MHKKVEYPQVVFLAGASGSGKTTLANDLNITQFNLDHFYKDDSPELPKIYGKKTDWDLPEVWDEKSALDHLLELIETRRTSYVKYDMVTNKKLDDFNIEINADEKYILCEGIFTYLIIPKIQEMNRCADIIWLEQNKLQNSYRRVKRDLEGKRSAIGFSSFRSMLLLAREKKLKKEYIGLDARMMSYDNAYRYLKQFEK